VTRRLVPLAAGAFALAGIGLATAAARTALAPEQSPLTAAGRWVWAWRLGLIVALAAYIVGVVAIRRRGARTAAVLALAAAIQLAPLAAPLILSKDVFAYWAGGRIGAVHDANPYEDVPSEYPRDPAKLRVGGDWLDQTSLYGPSFVLVSEAHAGVVGDDPDAAAFAYKCLGAASALGLVAVGAAIARRRAFAAVVIGWNPLLALHLAGGGHNDGLMMLLVLGALGLATRGHPKAAGAAWALAAAIKWMPLVLFPLVVLAAARTRLRLLAGFALGVVAVALVATVLYGGAWPGALGTGAGQLQRVASIGPASWLAAAGLPSRAVTSLLTLAFLGGYALLLVQAARARARLGLAGGLFAATRSWLNPWYAIWTIPLTAVEEDDLALAVALALTAVLVFDAIPS